MTNNENWEKDWGIICSPLADASFDARELRIFQEKSYRFIDHLLAQSLSKQKETFRNEIKEVLMTLDGDMAYEKIQSIYTKLLE